MLNFLKKKLKIRSAKEAIKYSFGLEFLNNPEITVGEALERTIQSPHTNYTAENLRNASKELGYDGDSKVRQCLAPIYLRGNFMSSPKLHNMQID